MKTQVIIKKGREVIADNDGNMPVISRSVRAIKKCAKWLKYCLEIGYENKDIEKLEELWWEHHDWTTGEVVRNG